MSRYVEDTYSDRYEPTVGVEFGVMLVPVGARSLSLYYLAKISHTSRRQSCQAANIGYCCIVCLFLSDAFNARFYNRVMKPFYV